MEVTYYINGVNLIDYGVYISASEGLIGRPKPKEPTSYAWADYHGEVVDLSKKIYEKRKIQLECFIKAENKEAFLTKLNSFVSIFDAPGTQRLMVVVDINRPLVYEVYLATEIDPKKKWSDREMVGTFKLELIEPNPIKRVIRYSGEEGSVTLETTKAVDIYWGDGSVTNDVIGEDLRNHSYENPDGTYYIIVAGNIDEITYFETNGQVVWNKL